MISFKLSSNPLNCLPVTVLTKSNTKSMVKRCENFRLSPEPQKNPVQVGVSEFDSDRLQFLIS